MLEFSQRRVRDLFDQLPKFPPYPFISPDTLKLGRFKRLACHNLFRLHHSSFHITFGDDLANAGSSRFIKSTAGQIMTLVRSQACPSGRWFRSPSQLPLKLSPNPLSRPQIAPALVGRGGHVRRVLSSLPGLSDLLRNSP
jgi:hypothetical protein